MTSLPPPRTADASLKRSGSGCLSAAAAFAVFTVAAAYAGWSQGQFRPWFALVAMGIGSALMCFYVGSRLMADARSARRLIEGEGLLAHWIYPHPHRDTTVDVTVHAGEDGILIGNQYTGWGERNQLRRIEWDETPPVSLVFHLERTSGRVNRPVRLEVPVPEPVREEAEKVMAWYRAREASETLCPATAPVPVRFRPSIRPHAPATPLPGRLPKTAACRLSRPCHPSASSSCSSFPCSASSSASGRTA